MQSKTQCLAAMLHMCVLSPKFSCKNVNDCTQPVKEYMSVNAEPIRGSTEKPQLCVNDETMLLLQYGNNKREASKSVHANRYSINILK